MQSEEIKNILTSLAIRNGWKQTSTLVGSNKFSIDKIFPIGISAKGKVEIVFSWSSSSIMIDILMKDSINKIICKSSKRIDLRQTQSLTVMFNETNTKINKVIDRIDVEFKL